MSTGRTALVLPFLLAYAPAQETVHVNRLANETSPYLLQHKNNPVDWYPWGKEALERAKREDKPIFLSIGYSACHWCHVMEHESFENPEIAKVMNEKFINIKVDREERPDIDDIYMTAVVGMTGRGGWPMSVFLTPDLKPFYGGTYYPPVDSRGMPGFKRVLENIDRIWREKRGDVDKQADELATYLQKQLQPTAQPGDPERGFTDTASEQSSQRYDPVYGGFGQAPHFQPKFPHASELSMLLRHYARTGDKKTLSVVETTITKMALGGIYDQLGGGFHRYSVDREWLAPHFEKMLYDNAQLARLLAELYQVTENPLYERVLRETLDYLLREMQDEKGGFYSTQDADSEGEEGKFFVWQKSELDDLLGDDSAIACLRWGVSEGGNWEHKNILHVTKTIAEVAEEVGVSEDDVRAALERARVTLLAHRDKRIHPGTDDKVLTAWNGLAIAAFATAYQVLGDERYLDAARKAADFVLVDMRKDGRLLRTWRDGNAHLQAYLEDYSFLAEALLCLFEADFDARWLAEAHDLLVQMEAHFLDAEDGAFFFTADDHEKLVARNKSISESSVPSGQAMAAMAFLRGGLLLGDQHFEEIGLNVIRANHAILRTQPIAAPSLLLALEFHLGDPREVVIAGPRSDPAVARFLAKARGNYPPHFVVTVLDDDNREALQALAPVYEGKGPVDGKPVAYVCRRGVCEAPTTDPDSLKLR